MENDIFKIFASENASLDVRAYNAANVMAILNKNNIKFEYFAQKSESDENKFKRYPFGLYKVVHNNIDVLFFLVSPLIDEVRFVQTSSADDRVILMWNRFEEPFEDFYERELSKFFN